MDLLRVLGFLLFRMCAFAPFLFLVLFGGIVEELRWNGRAAH